MSSTKTDAAIAISTEDARAIVLGRHDDPFRVLGPHKVGRSRHVTAFDPGATELAAVVAGKAHALAPVPDAPGVFSGKVPGTKPYSLRGTSGDGSSWEFEDAYRFGPVMGEMDEYLLSEGTHQRIWQVLGAQTAKCVPVAPSCSITWAPM